MSALAEKHTRRPVELRNDDALGTVDHEGALLGHIRNRAEIYILDRGVKILMVGIGAIEFQLRLERDTIGETSLETFGNGISRWVDIVVEKLQYEIVASVGNGEIFRKHFVEALVFPEFGWSVQLQEVFERLQLDLEEVRKRKLILYRREIDAWLFG